MFLICMYEIRINKNRYSADKNLHVHRLVLVRGSARVTGSIGRVSDLLAGRWTAPFATARNAAEQLGQPMPMLTRRTSDAGKRPAGTSAGGECPKRSMLTTAAVAPGTFGTLSDLAMRSPAIFTEIP